MIKIKLDHRDHEAESTVFEERRGIDVVDIVVDRKFMGDRAEGV